MLDQAHTLRQLVETASTETFRSEQFSPPMIVVAGSRGRVGTTTVAANIAAVLADQGECVVFVDAAHNAGLAQALGVRSVVQRSLAEVISGECSAAEALAPGPAGTRLLAQRRVPQQALDTSRPAQQRLFGQLHSLESEASLLVVDAGSGPSPWMRRFWRRAKLVIVVATTDDLALLDAYALVKQNAGAGVQADIRVLANQCDSDAIASEACSRLTDACRRFLSCSVRALPALPRHASGGPDGDREKPRVWERPNSPFGHAVMWLGRAVGNAMKNEG